MKSLCRPCCVLMWPPSRLSTVPADLSPEERSELEEIRRRKGALLLEIQRLKEELREAIIEVEGLESSTEGRSVSHLPDGNRFVLLVVAAVFALFRSPICLL